MLLLGSGRGEGALRRAVWAPGIMDRKQARKRGLVSRCHFLEGDFLDLPQLDRVDAVFAIESFSHGTDPAAFFRQAGKILKDGRWLIICDDFLVDEHPAIGSKSRYPSTKRNSWLSRFKRGWHINTLLSRQELLKVAIEQGFVLQERTDLTPFLRPTPLPLLLLSQQMARVPLPFPYRDSLRGGTALQICIRNGWTEYLFLVFQNNKRSVCGRRSERSQRFRKK